MDIERIIENLTVQRNIIKMRLERLRNNKDREIAEYMRNEILTNPGYVGYETIRKDLENSYLAKENELENQIKEIEKQLEEVQKQLQTTEEHIEKVEEEKEKFDKEEIEDSIVNYKNSGYRQNALGYYFNANIAKYDPDYRPWEDPLFNFRLNKEQAKKIDQSVVQNNDEIVDFGSPILENQEEIESLEQVRPAIENDEKKGTIQIDPENLEKVDFGSPILENQEEIENLEQVRPAINPEEETNEINFSDEITEFDNACEMLVTIYDDVLEGLRKTNKRTFRLEDNKLVHKKNGTKEYSNLDNLDLEETQITLPNGTYINENDIVKAFNNYRKENKGRTFKVKGFDPELQINRKSIKKFKKKLRELSVISLVKENKLSIFDIKRVYGKEKGEEYSKKVYFGETEETMAAGNYVNLEEIQEIVNEVFVEKTPSWIEKFKQLFKSKETNVVSIEDEEIYVENPEKDESEVLKGFDLTQLIGKLNLEGMPYDDIKTQDLRKTATVSLEQEKNDDIKQVNLSKDAVAELESLDFDDIKTLDLRKIR